jgi:hypothetical protein
MESDSDVLVIGLEDFDRLEDYDIQEEEELRRIALESLKLKGAPETGYLMLATGARNGEPRLQVGSRESLLRQVTGRGTEVGGKDRGQLMARRPSQVEGMKPLKSSCRAMTGGTLLILCCLAGRRSDTWR